MKEEKLSSDKLIGHRVNKMVSKRIKKSIEKEMLSKAGKGGVNSQYENVTQILNEIEWNMGWIMGNQSQYKVNTTRLDSN